jgi:hypothetical protein
MTSAARLVLLAVLPALSAVACRPTARDDLIRPDDSATPAQRPADPFGDLASEFVADAAASRWPAAYARASRAYRETVTVDTFSAELGHNPWFRAGAKFKTTGGSSAYPGKVARIEGWIEAPSGNAWTSVYFGFEDGTWAITGMIVGGAPALPLPLPPPGKQR